MFRFTAALLSLTVLAVAMDRVDSHTVTDIEEIHEELHNIESSTRSAYCKLVAAIVGSSDEFLRECINDPSVTVDDMVKPVREKEAAEKPKKLPDVVGPELESGAVYTRWGRTTCPRGATTVYEGFAAGSYFTHTGGGTNYQCLPLNPEFDEVQLYDDKTTNYIYGAEYQTYKHPGTIPETAHNQNVPCARCLAARSSVMMLPARRNCPPGWTREYHGYLMSSFYNNPHPTTYECVDGSPEYIMGEQSDQNGALFYNIQVKCNGNGDIAHCPPYEMKRSLLCAVCSI